MNYTINKEVEVNAYYFTNNQNLKSYPRKITVDHEQHSFTELVMQYMVRQGQHLIRLFDMTDGIDTYRLRNENEQWILVSRKAIHA